MLQFELVSKDQQVPECSARKPGCKGAASLVCTRCGAFLCANRDCVDRAIAFGLRHYPRSAALTRMIQAVERGLQRLGLPLQPSRVLCKACAKSGAGTQRVQ